MRTRNIKINVFLNEHEKQMLLDKSSKDKLSQSEFIRNLINNCSNSKTTNNNIDEFVVSSSEIIDNLLLLKKQMDFLNYSDYSNFINKQIYNINDIIKKLHN